MEILSDPVVGRTIDGRYEVSERLARGGMATVYLATDKRLDRRVALKVMHPHLADDPNFRSRFYREARTAASISHPGIVSVFDQGADGGTTYLAMEYVQGMTLREVITQDAPLSLRRSLGVTEQILEALGAAHTSGLVHRDMKPENVLVGGDGRIKVADFGLARAAEQSRSNESSGVLMGTIAYVAPEIVNEHGSDERSDVYALGVMLFELLTGQQPYTGDTAITVAYKHVNDDFPLPSSIVRGIPEAIDELVLWATAKDPDDRPSNAWEMLAELRDIRTEIGDIELDSRPVAHAASAAGAATAGATRSHTSPLPKADFERMKPVHDDQPMIVEERPRRKRSAGQVMWAVVALVFIGLVTAAIIAWYALLGPGSYSQAPNVTAKAESDAVQVIEASGFASDVTKVYDKSVPLGSVVRTEPEAGANVRKGSSITLFVSNGSPTLPTPNIVGKSVDEAERILGEEDLKVGNRTEEYDDTVEKGNIARQEPASGQDIDRGQSVDVVISRGKEPLEIPSVVNMSESKATKLLQNEGFTVSVTPQFSDDIDKGTVMTQSPGSGEGFRGDTITITVSKGPSTVTMPDLRNKPADDAVKTLKGLGLKADIQELGAGLFNTVWSTNPRAGEKVKVGSTVIVEVF